MPGSDKPGADQVTLIATTAIPRFRCVDVDASGQAILSAGTRYVGVSLGPVNTPGQACSVGVGPGVWLIEAAGAIAAGASVGCDATGRAITGKAGVGVALEPALAAGQIIGVLACRGNGAIA